MFLSIFLHIQLLGGGWVGGGDNAAIFFWRNWRPLPSDISWLSHLKRKQGQKQPVRRTRWLSTSDAVHTLKLVCSRQSNKYLKLGVSLNPSECCGNSFYSFSSMANAPSIIHVCTANFVASHNTEQKPEHRILKVRLTWWGGNHDGLEQKSKQVTHFP